MNTQSSLVILLVLFVSGCIAQTPSINTTTPDYYPTPNFTRTSSPTETTFPTETAVPSATAVASTTPLPTIEIGRTSTHDPSAEYPVITEIHMSTKTSGWAFASRGADVLVLHSTDGGNSWRDVTPPIEIWSDHIEQSERYTPPQLGEGYFFDGDRAWIPIVRIDKHMPRDIYTTRIMLATTDGGITWQMQRLPPEGFGEGHFPGFIDPMHGWFALFEPYTYGQSYTGLYRTVDGGESWEIVFSTPGTSSGLRAFAFGDPTTGVLTISMIGWYSGLYVRWTHDGGTNWEAQSLPEPEDPAISDPSMSDLDCGSIFPHAFSKFEVALLVECRMLNPEKQYVFSHYLYSTEDGGLSWQSSPAPSGRLHLINPDTGWILGKEIHFTDNGGETWTKINEVAWEGQFSFIDANHGWAVARNAEEIALVKTEDGGQSWAIVEPRLLP